VGPNAFQTLQAAKIDIYTGLSGSVKEALALYKTGKIKITASASVGSKSGMTDLNK
jgi:predicted Fe-Mo cluster-binding NifX family protein